MEVYWKYLISPQSFLLNELHHCRGLACAGRSMYQRDVFGSKPSGNSTLLTGVQARIPHGPCWRILDKAGHGAPEQNIHKH